MLAVAGGVGAQVRGRHPYRGRPRVDGQLSRVARQEARWARWRFVLSGAPFYDQPDLAQLLGPLGVAGPVEHDHPGLFEDGGCLLSPLASRARWTMGSALYPSLTGAEVAPADTDHAALVADLRVAVAPLG